MKWLRYAGPTAMGWAWIIIVVSASVNPTFSVLKSPLSALGSPGAIDPWIYDMGMMSVGLLILLYSLHLATVAVHWVEAFASGLFGVAGIFLALVGIYHSGTYPHDFVSLWFFMQSAMASMVWGLGELASGFWRGIAFVALGIGAPVLAFTVHWPSNGLEECFGILAINAYTLLVFSERRMRSPHTPAYALPRSNRPSI